MFGCNSAGRPLTVRERALAHSVFRDAIDYDRVRIHNRKWWWFQPRKITMAPDGNLWFHPQSNLFCEEFCDRDIGLQGLFIHELVHVWQHQMGVFLPLARHPFCRYEYRLEPGRHFLQYGIEQQAEIVRHVFLLRNGRQPKGAAPLDHYSGLLPF
jgi:hypothetical protein